jgi:hypothetical protein
VNRDEWTPEQRVAVWRMEQQLRAANGGWADVLAHFVARRAAK